MDPRIKKALDLKPGDTVTAAHSSDGPAALTRGKQYTVISAYPIHSSYDRLGLPRPNSFVCNADIKITDDKGKKTPVSYINFNF